MSIVDDRVLCVGIELCCITQTGVSVSLPMDLWGGHTNRDIWTPQHVSIKSK